MRNGPSFRLRMAEMNTLGSSGATSLLKQRYPEQVAQDHVQTAFDFLQGWRSQSLWATSKKQPSVILTVKKYFLLFRPSFLCAKWITSLRLLPTLLLMQPRTPLALRSKDKLLAHVQLGPQHIHRLLMKFLSAYFSSLLNSSWMAVQPSGVSVTSPILCHQQICWGHSVPHHLATGQSLVAFPYAQLWSWFCSRFLSMSLMQLNTSLVHLLMTLN